MTEETDLVNFLTTKNGTKKWNDLQLDRDFDISSCKKLVILKKWD